MRISIGCPGSALIQPSRSKRAWRTSLVWSNPCRPPSRRRRTITGPEICSSRAASVTPAAAAASDTDWTTFLVEKACSEPSLLRTMNGWLNSAASSRRRLQASSMLWTCVSGATSPLRMALWMRLGSMSTTGLPWWRARTTPSVVPMDSFHMLANRMSQASSLAISRETTKSSAHSVGSSKSKSFLRSCFTSPRHQMRCSSLQPRMGPAR